MELGFWFCLSGTPALSGRSGHSGNECVVLRGLIVLRVPLEGGGRLVVSVNDTEAKELYKVLEGVVKK